MNEAFHIRPVGGIQAADDTAGDLQFMTVKLDRFRYVIEYFTHDQIHVSLLRDVGQDDGKFIPAQAGHRIPFPQACFQTLGDD